MFEWSVQARLERWTTERIRYTAVRYTDAVAMMVNGTLSGVNMCG